jgi:hypothetical protein
MPVFGPEVAFTTGHAPVSEGAKVVAGMGTEPGFALRDLRKLAQIEVTSAGGGEGWQVIGVSLVPGPIPDRESGERGALRPGWCAVGTLIRPGAKDEAGVTVRRAG